MIDQLKNMSLPLTGRQEAEDGRPHWTAIWQLPPGLTVRCRWLCRSLSGPARAVQAAGGHQGAACSSERPGSRTLPARSRDHRYAGPPSIVRVFDFDVQDGVPFLVMEYAPNGSL